MMSIIMCTVVIGLSGVLNASPSATGSEATTPTWVPVIFGLICPVFFTVNGLLVKYLVSETYNFNPTILAFSSYLSVNLLVMIVALFYWHTYQNFSTYLFWWGLIGCVINTLGLVCFTNAMSCGPCGPIAAIAATPSFFLVVIESIKGGKLISMTETIALIFGFYGVLVLVIPDFFARICCFCCLDRVLEDKLDYQVALKDENSENEFE